MPTNDFIGFAAAGSANVMSQADYAAAAEQTDGVQPGPASSALANKVWRQGANMAAAIGKVISDQGQNALDNGDLNALKNSVLSAFMVKSDAAALAPVPTAGAVVGQWQRLFINASSLSLPAGGSWAYYVTGFSSGGSLISVQSSVAAGGTVVINDAQISRCYGFCWRIA